MMRRFGLFLCLVILSGSLSAQDASPRWSIESDHSLLWTVKDAHLDNIEMSGLGVSMVVEYGSDEEGRPILVPAVVWPGKRTLPNDTHASLIHKFEGALPLLSAGDSNKEKLVSVRLDGTLRMASHLGDLQIERICFPSTAHEAVFIITRFTNLSNSPAQPSLQAVNQHITTDPFAGVEGAYVMTIETSSVDNPIAPGATESVVTMIAARGQGEPLPALDAETELAARQKWVRELDAKAAFECPSPEITTLYRFAKIRAAESIYRTKGGLMHGPGGTRYYAAIWANDQAEYANPFFAYLGYENGAESAVNSFRHFAHYMNPAYKPIPSSIIAEGMSYWNGAGDRGDMAMIAYGAGRYALARGDRAEAERLWPLIEWCLEFLHRKVTPQGIIASDSDELEGRLPAGKANLNTSCLAYDALISAHHLARELGDSQSDEYLKRANALKAAIESYFGAEVQGYLTYRYYEGNDVLRAWIATPLTTGLFDRSAGTIDALFSPELWTPDGLASQSGDKIFWDRSTLYGFRGVIAAGAVDRALPYLQAYSARRLRGEHVPYPVEAWPEGNQRHLSAESALYCRIMSEGFFGYRPTGFNRFTLNVQMPTDWKEMSLGPIEFCGRPLLLRATRNGKALHLLVGDAELDGQIYFNGEADGPVEVKLPG